MSQPKPSAPRWRPALPPFKRLALLMLVAVPIAAWAFVKPVRVIAPGLAGISCPAQPVCVEDPATLPAAERLYADSLAFVAQAAGPLEGRPRVIFCSTPACARSFGLGARAAVTVATAGTVVAPRGWTPYYVRHELIHQLQSQRLGELRLLLKPSWFVEGMAYALSEDPRQPLAEPFQGYRTRFIAWYATVGKGALWQQARAL